MTFAGRTLSANARFTRCGTTLTNWGVGHFGWQAEWWCADPLRYGDLVIGTTSPAADTGGLAYPLFGGSSVLAFPGLGSAGTVTLENPGTAPAWPSFVLTGPFASGFEIAEQTTGRRIRWESAVPAGVQVTVDSRTGAVTYGGQPGFEGNLTARGWWSVPPRGSRVAQLNAIGSPNPLSSMAVSCAATYW